MPNRSKVVNPFYLLLVLAGCAFVITAASYAVMSLRELNRGRMAVAPAESSPPTAAADDRFSDLLDRQGPKIMLLELLLLGIGTVGAMAVDRYFVVDLPGPQRVSNTPDDAGVSGRPFDTDPSNSPAKEAARQ